MATFYVDQKTGQQLSGNQLTPGQSYITSGTGASYTAPQNTNAIVPQASPSANTGTAIIPQAPAAQSPMTPAPQPSTPPAPAAYQQPPQPPLPQQPAPTTTQTQPGTQQNTQQNTQSAQGQQGLTMPASGSVVDLLNAAGQDSSYAARQQLAQQFGVQNYQGTAQQNQDLGQKFMDFYNQNKGSAVPQNGADARAALSDQSSQQSQDPQASYIDQYTGLNPVLKNIYDSVSNTLASLNSKQSLSDMYNQMYSSSIGPVQTDLMNINNVMRGSEQDIRDEITKAGGFATDSQVQALTGTRNRLLQKQASQLTDQLQVAQDYVDKVVGFTQTDRSNLMQQVQMQTGLAENMAQMQNTMTNAARTNYQSIVSNIGYDGLAQSLQSNPTMMPYVESLLGLPGGSLSDPTFLKNAQTLKEQTLAATIAQRGISNSLSQQRLGIQLTVNGLPGGSTVGVGGSTPTPGANTQTVNGMQVSYTPDGQLASIPKGLSSGNTLADDAGLALFNGTQAPSQVKGRGVLSQNALDTADKISLAITGNHFDPAAAESAYKFRQSDTFMKYTANAPVAVSTIQQISQLAQNLPLHDFSPLSEARISAIANGLDPSLIGLSSTQRQSQISSAKELQSLMAISQDDIGLLLGSGSGSDFKTKLGGIVFNASGSPRTTQDLANTITQRIGSKLSDYYAKAGVKNPAPYLTQDMSKMLGYSPTQSTGQQVTVQGRQFNVGQVYTDKNGVSGTFDINGKWTSK